MMETVKLLETFDDDDAPLADDVLLDEVVRAIVTRPADVKVVSRDGGKGKVLTIHADKVDRGRIIGKDGKTIRVLEQLMEIVGRPRGVRIDVRVEQEGFKPRHGGKARAPRVREPEVMSRRGTAA